MSTEATREDPTGATPAPSRRAGAVVADLAERAGWTAGQVFCGVLLTTSSGPAGTIQLPWRLALVMSTGAALTSLVTSGLLQLGRLTRLTYWADVAVRLAKTFIATLVGAYAASLADVLAFDWGAALDLAVVTTVAAMAKGLLARQAGPGGQTPSTLPAAVYANAVAR